jgi:four helix bundle protein
MSAKLFEDLQVWKDSRKFVKSIYELTSLNNFQNDYGFKDQIQRAAVSVMNNISEGFERDNNKEFINFLNYAKGSAGEVRSMLYAALDLNYISENKFSDTYSNSIDIIKQISNFRKYLKNYLMKERINKIKIFLLHIIKI